MAVKHLHLPPRRLPPRLFGIRVKAPHQRRLSDKVLVAFHVACDEGAFVMAERLLTQLEQLIRHPPLLPTGSDRRRPEQLTAPAERLANLLLWRMQGADFHP